MSSHLCVLFIVTAAVYRSFGLALTIARSGRPLTYRHWAGVSPYTSPCGFAGTCVFAKQSVGNRLLRPDSSPGRTSCELTSSYFAEFLKLSSLARLGTLIPAHQCRFAVRLASNLTTNLFSQADVILNCIPCGTLCITAQLNVPTDFPVETALQLTPQFIRGSNHPTWSVPSYND